MNRASQQQTDRSSPIPCEFCGSTIESRFYRSHLNICSKDPHAQNLDRSIIPCEVCNTRIPFEEYSKHMDLHLAAEDQPATGDLSINSEEDFQDSVSQRVFQVPSANTRGRRQPNRQLSPESIFMEDSFFGDGLEIEREIERDFGRDFPIRRIAMQMRGSPFPTAGLLDSIFNDRRVGHSGRSQRDEFEALLTRFITPMQRGHDIEIVFEQPGGQPEEQGFKKEELDRNFITAKYDKNKSKDLQEDNKKCLICLSEFENGEELRFLECCHRFHKNCIDHWMKSKTTCPICKKDFKDFQTN